MRFTTLLNYPLIDWLIDWLVGWLIDWLTDDAMFVCLHDDLILDFCYVNLTLETDDVELALTITPVLQANQLTKCASQPVF